MLDLKRWLAALATGLLIAGPLPAWAEGAPNATKDAQGRWGATDAEGRVVVPFRYAGLRFDDHHQRFEAWLDVGGGRVLQGILDPKGAVVVPFVYDALQRISNMGDEPTHLARQGRKYGYVDIVSGETLIPPEYDALRVDSLMTDARGRGLVVAVKGGKAGVLSTENEVIVPFVFDAIGDLSLSTDGALAERAGRLVQLAFKGRQYLGEREAPTVYASNFTSAVMPRTQAGLNPAPLDGLYAASDYPDMLSAWRGWRNRQLRWAAIPSIQIEGGKAYVAFGVFAKTGLPLLPNQLAVRRTAPGFELYLDEGGTPFSLGFKAVADGVRCPECATLGLPSHWKRVAVEAPAPFGGIGVAIHKAPEPGAPLKVLDVQADGPAGQAGLRAGDHIVSIDGREVGGLTAEAARDALRGPAGSQVRLVVAREGLATPLALSITRRVIQIRR